MSDLATALDQLKTSEDSQIDFEIPGQRKPISCSLTSKCQFQNTLLILSPSAGGDMHEKPVGFATTRIRGSVDISQLQYLLAGTCQTMPTLVWSGKGQLKGRTAVLKSIVKEIKSILPECRIVLGGRSMGARVAVNLCLTEPDLVEPMLALHSYPLIAGGKKASSAKDKEREEALLSLPETCRVLLCSGDKDPMFPIEDIARIRTSMAAKTWLISALRAKHSMDIGATGTELLGKRLGEITSAWIREQPNSTTRTIEWDKSQAELREEALRTTAEGDAEDGTATTSEVPEDAGGDEEQKRPVKRQKRT